MREAIEAMGMLPALANRWRRNQLHTQDLLDILPLAGAVLSHPSPDLPI